MATAGAVGAVLDETLRHAEELLDIVDDAVPNHHPLRAEIAELRNRQPASYLFTPHRDEDKLIHQILARPIEPLVPIDDELDG